MNIQRKLGIELDALARHTNAKRKAACERVQAALVDVKQ